jgi:hypothetical protein
MRGRLLLAAALLLVLPSVVPADEPPRVDAHAVLVFECGAHRWVFLEADALAPGGLGFLLNRLVPAMHARGFHLTEECQERLRELVVAYLKGPSEAERDQDAEALVAGGGKFPEGYVPAGREKRAEIPPLDFLGAKVVLEIVGGEPRARVTDAPEGSRARKIGLGRGDAILEVNGTVVGPGALLLFEERAAAGAQQGLRVRRTHGEIERVVVDSWDRASAGR